MNEKIKVQLNMTYNRTKERKCHVDKLHKNRHVIKLKSKSLTPFKIDTASFESQAGYPASSCKIISNISSSLSA